LFLFFFFLLFLPFGRFIKHVSWFHRTAFVGFFSEGIVLAISIIAFIMDILLYNCQPSRDLSLTGQQASDGKLLPCPL
jgi:hypothetical protein